MTIRPRAERLVDVCALAAALLLLLPLVGIVARVPWSSLLSQLGQPRVWSALSLSALVAAGAVLLSVALGLPVAALLARRRTLATSVLRALVTMPMVLPPVVAGVGLLFALGRRGVFGDLLFALGVELPFTTLAAVLAATFVAAPFFVLTVEAGFAAVDADQLDVARSLGAGPWTRFVTVVLPALRPSLWAGTALCFARALGEFGATITFAGNLEGRTQTLPLLVYEAMHEGPEEAALVSLLLVAFSVVVLVAARPGARP